MAALSALTETQLRPASAPDRPDVDWPPETAASVLDRYGPGSGGQALAVLAHVHRVEPAMTSDFLTSLPAGARAEGLQWRVKSPASLARKIATKVEAKALSPAAAAESCQDVVRYTAAVRHPTDLVDGTRTLVAGLQSRGWRVREVEQSYVDPQGVALRQAYKGLHVILEKDGVTCEVQVHSETSLEVKTRSHELYELERDLDRPRVERAQAHRSMVQLWEKVPAPPGLAGLTSLAGVPVAVKQYPNRYVDKVK